MNRRSSIVICAGILLAVSTATAEPPAAAPKKLDLKPPDITTVFTSAQIARLAHLSDADVEEVSVEAARPVAVPQEDVPSGASIIPWLVSPRNTSTAPDATAVNATIAHPPVFAGQAQPYDR